MPAKQYFKTCLEQHRRTTNETNQMIAARMGCVPNWLSQLSHENYPQSRPGLSNFEEICAAIPTLDREVLLAHILQDEYPAAAQHIASWMECAYASEDLALLKQLRAALADIGITGRWELADEDLSAGAAAFAQLIARRQAEEAAA